MEGVPLNTPSRTYAEIFEELLPFYLSIGMPASEYWDGPPKLARAYRKAYEMRVRERNIEQWRNGLYMCYALEATVGSMFSKERVEYLREPLPLTEAEREEQEQREERRRMEAMKAALACKAAVINQQMPKRGTRS